MITQLHDLTADILARDYVSGVDGSSTATQLTRTSVSILFLASTFWRRHKNQNFTQKYDDVRQHDFPAMGEDSETP